MSVKQENGTVISTTGEHDGSLTSPHVRTDKRSWMKLMKGRRPVQAQNSTASQDSQVGVEGIEMRSAKHSAPIEQPSPSPDISSQGPQDHKTPRVAWIPFKTIYRWFRANTFQPVWLPRWLRSPVSGYLATVLLQVV